jgi:hypothetical protein
VKVSSNVGAAKEAVQGFAAVHRDAAGRQVSLSTSTASGMRDGVAVANGLGGRLDGLVSAVKAQADRVTALATEIERRDKQDELEWSKKR